MFHGSMVALVTPMKSDLSLDEAALRRLVNWHIDNGTSAIVVNGTTGESATLTTAEKRQTLSWVVSEAKQRIPVIAGTAAVSVPATIEMTQTAMELGADACLLLAPPYVKPTQEGLYLYYREVARAVAIPQFIYNVPGRTVCDVLPETIARLADVPNIVAVKEATGDLTRVTRIRELCGEKIDIYSGDDFTAAELMMMGGRGVISVTANVLPKMVADMSAAALAGDEARARALSQAMNAVNEALFIEANPIPVKWALNDMGMIGPGIRLPLTELSEAYHEMVRAAIAAC